LVLEYGTNNKRKDSIMKRKTIALRKKRNLEKGIVKGKSKYAIKETNNKRGIYSKLSPFSYL